MEETWRDIPGYEGKYQVSDYGRVKSLLTDKILRGDSHRYTQVVLCKDGIKTHKLVHRLVWEAFKGHIPQGMQINHMNEIKTDNRLINLSLTTIKENCNWGTRNKRLSEVQLNDKKKSKPVLQYDLEGRLIGVFESAHEAARRTGITRAAISNACRAQFGTHNMNKHKCSFYYKEITHKESA